MKMAHSTRKYPSNYITQPRLYGLSFKERDDRLLQEIREGEAAIVAWEKRKEDDWRKHREREKKREEKEKEIDIDIDIGALHMEEEEEEDQAVDVEKNDFTKKKKKFRKLKKKEAIAAAEMEEDMTVITHMANSMTLKIDKKFWSISVEEDDNFMQIRASRSTSNVYGSRKPPARVWVRKCSSSSSKQIA